MTLHGPTTLVKTSADGNSTADAALIPLPAGTSRWICRSPGRDVVTGQAWNGDKSHDQLAEFCWDLTMRRDHGERARVLHAAAPGEVVAVRETAPSGETRNTPTTST